MKKIRFTFCRAKCAIYLSNVEIEKLFITAFKEVQDKMRVAYSSESNPKMLLDFALNLPIGIESIGEVAEVVMAEDIKIPFFIKALNEVLPQGIAVLSAKYIDTDEQEESQENVYKNSTIPEPKLCDKVYRVTYEIWFIYNENEFKGKNKRQIEDIKKWYVDRMREFLSQSSIYIVRKNGDKAERLNIKQQINAFSFMLDDSLLITIDAGIKSALTPSDIIRGYEEYAGQPIDYSVRRRQIFIK